MAGLTEQGDNFMRKDWTLKGRIWYALCIITGIAGLIYGTVIMLGGDAFGGFLQYVLAVLQVLFYVRLRNLSTTTAYIPIVAYLLVSIGMNWWLNGMTAAIVPAAHLILSLLMLKDDIEKPQPKAEEENA